MNFLKRKPSGTSVKPTKKSKKRNQIQSESSSNSEDDDEVSIQQSQHDDEIIDTTEAENAKRQQAIEKIS